MPSSLPCSSVTMRAPMSRSSSSATASPTVVSGRTVTGVRGWSRVTGSSMRLRSTRLAAVGWSSWVRSCWQQLHSSAPGRLSCMQVGQIMRRALRLLDDPDVVAGEQVFQLALALGLDRLLDLLVEHLVVGRPLDGAEDADALREARVDHPAEQVGEARLLGPLVVDEQVVGGDAVAERDDLGVEAVQADAL